MFIQTEETPNPAALKFIPGVDVMGTGNAEFNSEEEAKNSPLAKCLFNIDGVQSVFLGSDFIAVTKIDSLEWFSLKPAILAAIMEHYASGLPVVEILDQKASS